MSCDLYKKIGIELLATLSNKEHSVICITSSHMAVDTCGCAKELADAFCMMDLSVTLVNAKVGGVEEISKTEPKKINEKLSEVSFEKKDGFKLTSFLAKEAVNEIKTNSDITVIALDEITDSAPAIMLASCCDGAILAERKDLSRTDNIDRAVQIINNIYVKPLGFILV